MDDRGLSMVDVTIGWLSSEGSLNRTGVSAMRRRGGPWSLRRRGSFSYCGIVAGRLCQCRSSPRHGLVPSARGGWSWIRGQGRRMVILETMGTGLGTGL